MNRMNRSFASLVLLLAACVPPCPSRARSFVDTRPEHRDHRRLRRGRRCGRDRSPHSENCCRR
jgi:hypothetical protein